MPANSQPTVDQLFNLGLQQQRAGDLAAATHLFEQVLTRRPRHWGAIQLLGVIAYQRGHSEAALVWLQKSIAIDPNQASTHGNLGLALHALLRFDEAIAAYQRALSLRPNDPDLHYNIGNALHRAGNVVQAILAYRKTLTLQPGHEGALNNLGNALKDQGDLDYCIAAFRQARVAQPDNIKNHSNLLLSLHYHPDFDPAQLTQEHREWSDCHASPIARTRLAGVSIVTPTFRSTVDPDRRLRIGYVSPDFGDHSVARFALPLITNHDPGKVELYAYSQINRAGPLAEQFRASMPGWRDISRLSDAAVAEQVRSDQIDILVDLAGHTAGNRLLIFAHKPAPVQVTYLGYPGTTGLREIDYRLADPLADPLGQTEQFYSETLLRIEPCAWCFEPVTDVPVPHRNSGPITFGSFNTLTKLNQPTFRIWSKILHAVPGSRLLLKSDGLRYSTSQERVHAQFAQFGIGAERLTLLDREPAHANHLALYGKLDIALDTFPYNGTTTTCEALWMGVPVITRAGDRHASRVGVSLLTQVELAECIAGSSQEFVDLAVRLSEDRQRLAELHHTLRSRMQASPLMDGPAFARRVEGAYRQIWRDWCAGLTGRGAPAIGSAPPLPFDERSDVRRA